MRNLVAKSAAAALLVPLVAALPTAVAQETVVVDDGHVDAVAVRVLDGQFRVQYKDGSRASRCGGNPPRW